MSDKIIIKNARVHNLKNVSLELPKNKLIVVTGLSGSGKSSLAFDTIYAEGQRRYAESLSAYARQFMEVRDKPDVDSIEGLSPTIAIDQKSSSQNPRSTVGTVSETYDYLRLLFAREGVQYCPDCEEKVVSYRAGSIVEKVRRMLKEKKVITILAPLIMEGKVKAEELVERVEKSGTEWVRINGEILRINDLLNFSFKTDEDYTVEVVVGKVSGAKKEDPGALVEKAIDLGNGFVIILKEDKAELFSTVGWCPRCKKIMPALDVRSFSFNSPYGACPHCTGLGVSMEVDPELVIPNPRLTLAEGAIQPWTRITGNQQFYQKLLAALAEAHGFSVHTPVESLNKETMNLIFHGTHGREYTVDNKKFSFPGVLDDLLNRYKETKSDYVRKEIEQYMREKLCPVCEGKKLRRESLFVKIGKYSISDLTEISLNELISEMHQVLKTGEKNQVLQSIVKELVPRLSNLSQVGLDYLSLGRTMNTLSGGEVTRVRLATQLSAGLTGVIYVLDEPSVGLHPRDTAKLIDTLKYLRDKGNTVVVVEHDAAIIKAADHLVDIGPGAGIHGGELIVSGTMAEALKNKNSLTIAYLLGKEKIEREKKSEKISKSAKAVRAKEISIIGAKGYNLKDIDVSIPLKKLVCVTGVSGSGKSTLIIDILSRVLSKHFYRAKEEPAEHKEVKGLENVDKVISIDQSPIGRTPRSNPATYTGVFTLIRDLFANLPEAKLRGYDAGKFSFNVKGGGRCEACAGEGYIRIPMQFLTDVFVECEECNGSRYNGEALEVHYKNKNIAEVLEMTIEEAFKFFTDQESIAEKLDVLRQVGLGYLHLGQPATNLSGGEAQRIKLATELSRPSTGNTLYILDEPTTGLHFEDVKHLLEVLVKLVEKGNSVLVIEHNTEVIRSADWVIDLGPDGGRDGGEVVAIGTPEDIKKCKKSWTGKYL